LQAALPPTTAQLLQAVNTTLTKQSVDDFLVALEGLSEPCQLSTIKKLDKKREKQLLTSHEEDIKNQLISQDQPATALQLAVILLWIQNYQAMLHIPPKMIQVLVSKLKEKLAQPQFEILKDFQTTVVKYLTASEKEKEKVHKDLVEKMPKLKELVSQK